MVVESFLKFTIHFFIFVYMYSREMKLYSEYKSHNISEDVPTQAIVLKTLPSSSLATGETHNTHK